MSKKVRTVCIQSVFILLILNVALNLQAEFYKYVDENGNVKYTDDINEVPEAQRSNIHSYVESQSREVPEQQEAVEHQAEPEQAGPVEQQANVPDLLENDPESLEDHRAHLEQMKMEIELEAKMVKMKN